MTVDIYYGTSSTYSVFPAVSSMTATGAFSRNVTGLTCGTTYHYAAPRQRAGDGSAVGADTTFTTTACTITPPPPTGTPPGLLTNTVTSPGATSAPLPGTLYNTGGATVTASFQYGTTTAYGSTASYGAMTTTGVFTKAISSLTCNTLYHYRAVGVNSYGTVKRNGRDFHDGSLREHSSRDALRHRPFDPCRRANARLCLELSPSAGSA